MNFECLIKKVKKLKIYELCKKERFKGCKECI